MQQDRDGRGEARAVARDHDRPVGARYIETDSAVFALMHIVRHVSQQRRQIDVLPRDRKFL
jgi:hypothetical protein